LNRLQPELTQTHCQPLLNEAMEKSIVRQVVKRPPMYVRKFGWFGILTGSMGMNVYLHADADSPQIDTLSHVHE